MVYPNDYLGPLYGQPVDGHDRCPGEGMSECVCMRARWHSIWHSINLRGRCVRALSNATLHVSPERQDVAQMRHAFPIIYPSIYPRKTKDRPSLSISLSLSILPSSLVYDVRSFSTRCRRQTARRRPAKISIRGCSITRSWRELIDDQIELTSKHLSHLPRDPIRPATVIEVNDHHACTRTLSLSFPFFHFCFWRSSNRIQSVEIPIHRFFLCVLFFFFFFSNVYADSSVFPF